MPQGRAGKLPRESAWQGAGRHHLIIPLLHPAPSSPADCQRLISILPLTLIQGQDSKALGQKCHACALATGCRTGTGVVPWVGWFCAYPDLSAGLLLPTQFISVPVSFPGVPWLVWDPSGTSELEGKRNICLTFLRVKAVQSIVKKKKKERLIKI